MKLIAAELLPVATENNVGVVARMPFDESALTGKLTEKTRFEEGDFRNNYFMGDRLTRTVAEVKKIQDDLSGSDYTLPQTALSVSTVGLSSGLQVASA